MATDESKLSFTPYVRVLQMAHKPDREEFLKVSAIVGGGAFLVGFIGMFVYALMILLPG